MVKLSKKTIVEGNNRPNNLDKIQESFFIQAGNFEKDNMNFSKQEFLDYTVKCMNLNENDIVLEAAAGTSACGRSIAPFVHSVTCLDATRAMLDVGQMEAHKSNLSNMTFLEGLVENIPFPDETFDIVISRLAFHHFVDIDKPFTEMNRVLKKGGKLVIIDMEAAPEDLRKIEDGIETMRDYSHVRNVSREEFMNLYKRNCLTITKNETTDISVSLDAWMALTQTPCYIADKIVTKMQEDINGKEKTGFNPHLTEDKIYFWQRWMLIIGEKME